MLPNHVSPVQIRDVANPLVLRPSNAEISSITGFTAPVPFPNSAYRASSSSQTGYQQQQPINLRTPQTVIIPPHKWCWPPYAVALCCSESCPGSTAINFVTTQSCSRSLTIINSRSIVDSGISFVHEYREGYYFWNSADCHED